MTMKHIPTRRLADVCKKITVGHVGTMASSYVEGGIPFLRSQNILPFRISLEEVKSISPAFHKRLSKSELLPGDVVVVRTGYPGTAAVVPRSLRIANCADLVVIRPGEEIDSWYLAGLFNSHWGMSHVAGNLVGVAQQHFNVSSAKEMSIPFPPLIVQRRIGSVLRLISRLIENNTGRIAILEEMVRAIYQEWFVRFRFPGHERVRLIDSPVGNIPEGWKPSRLGELAKEVRRGVDPSAVDPETPYIGLEHLPRRSITLGDWGKAKDVHSTKLSFKRGDILFGKIRPYFHKVGVAPVDGVCSSDAIVIVPNSASSFGPVICCVSSDDFIRHATQTSQGTKMPRANWDVLLKYSLPLPPDNLLAEFNALIGDAVANLRLLMFTNRNLRSTRDLLLPKLLSGQLDVAELDIEIGEPLVEAIA